MERPEIKQSLGDIGITEAHKIYTDSQKLFKHIQKLDNYIDYLEDELKNCLIADVMAMLPIFDLSKVNRVEVIDENGRSYVNWKPTNKTSISTQDNCKTLKVFIGN